MDVLVILQDNTCPAIKQSAVLEILRANITILVFPSEVIQPLFDMANPESEIYKQLDHQFKTTGIPNIGKKHFYFGSFLVMAFAPPPLRNKILIQHDDLLVCFTFLVRFKTIFATLKLQILT